MTNKMAITTRSSIKENDLAREEPLGLYGDEAIGVVGDGIRVVVGLRLVFGVIVDGDGAVATGQ